MAFSLPSLPKLPSKAPGMSLAPVAVLNAVSLIAKALPGLNPPRPIYAILDAETLIPLAIPYSWGEILEGIAEYQTTDYPVENGGFLVANKVRRPVTVSAVLIQTGSDLARAAWLEAIRQQLASNPLARYNILTPEGIFQNLTIVKLTQQKRPDRGSNMLYLEISFSEVPQIETPSLLGEDAVDEESTPTSDAGRVFPTDTPTPQANLAQTGAPPSSPLGGG